MRALASRIDDAVNQIEKVLILVSIAGMTLLVGADVVQRTFSRPVGKTASFIGWLGERLAGPLTPEGRATLQGPVADAVFVALALVMIIGATHASRGVLTERAGGPRPALLGSVARGAALFVVLALAVKALLWAFPSSVPGAQKFALGLMLWAGMLGASVATRERRHIVVDAVTKKLDAGDRRLFALLGGLATGVFCACITLLSGTQLYGEIHDWASNEGVGLYESLPIPTWIATLALPVAFAIMAARFVAYGVRDYLYGPPAGDLSHGVDLEELKHQTVDTTVTEPVP